MLRRFDQLFALCNFIICYHRPASYYIILWPYLLEFKLLLQAGALYGVKLINRSAAYYLIAPIFNIMVIYV